MSVTYDPEENKKLREMVEMLRRELADVRLSLSERGEQLGRAWYALVWAREELAALNYGKKDLRLINEALIEKARG